MQKMYMTHPIFPTPNIRKTADFYVQKLRFNAVEYLNFKEPHICLYKDDIEIMKDNARKTAESNFDYRPN